MGVIMLGLTLHMADASSIITNSAANACGTSCSTTLTVSGLFANGANVLIYLIGAISVIMVIIGGLRYVISQGDSAQTKSAKNTILYAAVGVAVALVSYAIVNFVSTNIK
jgi:hypothetical protein